MSNYVSYFNSLIEKKVLSPVLNSKYVFTLNNPPTPLPPPPPPKKKKNH